VKVSELIELLRTCNPNARVVLAKDAQIGDYTWDTEHVGVSDVLPWPEPKETADKIEIVGRGEVEEWHTIGTRNKPGAW
jgi:hypothetical protein